MEYTISQEKSEISIKFTTANEEWNEAVNNAYQKTKGQYKIPGFRPGRAPRYIIEQMYGSSVFTDDAIDYLINKCYGEALDEHIEIEPIDRPEIKIDSFDGKSLSFTAVIPVKPEVKLSEYKGLQLTKVEYPVASEQIEDEISKAAERSARIVEVGTEAKSGDIVNIDYSGSVDGVKFDGGTAEKHDLTLGSNSFIPGFEEQLVGKKKGDEVDVKVTFPKEYHAAELAGKEAVFACKVNSVSSKEFPSLDDKWASDISEFNTLDEYKASIKANLEEQSAKRVKTECENTVINAVVEKAVCDVPDALVNAYLDDMLRDFEMRLSYQGLKIDDYFKYTGTTVEAFREDRKQEAARGALTRLCLEEMVKLEKITVSDEEAEARYYEMFPNAQADKKAPAAREIGYIKNEIAMDKLLKLLVDSTVWTVAEAKTDGEAKPKKPAKAKTTAKSTKTKAKSE